MFDNWLKEFEKNLFDYKTIKSNTEKFIGKINKFWTDAFKDMFEVKKDKEK
jgi:hypothetical protein